MIHENDLNNDDYTATYCMADNKLRLYTCRVERSTYDYLRVNGFKATPKQDCDFVATWSINAEDICYMMIHESDDIGDEDQSPADRAADRAERFSMYRDKRRNEAGGFADRFDAGPSAHGYQSQARAERAAAKHNRLRGHALSQWSKAEYWQRRTQGVISHALHRLQPAVRRGRIIKLETELRHLNERIADENKRIKMWETIVNTVGSEDVLPLNESGNVIKDKLNDPQRWAYTAVNTLHHLISFWHPRCEEANNKCREVHNGRYRFSMHDLLVRTEFIRVPFERLSPKELGELYLENSESPSTPGSNSQRYKHHLEMQLAYENMMLENEGGKASDAEMEVGGWVGRYQIQKINRSAKTKAIVSVTVLAEYPYHRGYGPAPLVPTVLNIQRLGESAYRPPTDEERAAFAESQKESKAKAKEKSSPKLINPSVEDAEKLQHIWNENDKDWKREGREPPGVAQMTQEMYSANSKGEYALHRTISITEDGKSFWSNSSGYANGTVVFKVRARCGHNRRVVVLTDKPTTQIPWAEMERVKQSKHTIESITPFLGEVAKFLSTGEYTCIRDLPDDKYSLVERAIQLGLAYDQSMSQRGLTEAGRKLWSEYGSREATTATPS